VLFYVDARSAIAITLCAIEADPCRGAARRLFVLSGACATVHHSL